MFVWLNREKVEHRRGEPTTGWYETVCSHSFETTNNFGQSSIFSLAHSTESTTLPVEKIRWLKRNPLIIRSHHFLLEKLNTDS